MWKRTAKGLALTFHLAGINNQNFLMRDDQTGTFWQQISGRAISGPMAGEQLELVYSDELTFGLWRSEAPNGTVLKPVEQYSTHYETKNWDVRMAKVPTVLDFPNSGLESRDLVLGISAFGASRAYPVQGLLREKLVEDRLGGEPILVVVGPDEKSIRVFEARIHSREPASREPASHEPAADYYRETAPSSASGLFMDSATGSEWDFSGCATSGKLEGTCLARVPAVKDYWFDWRNYHPDTSIFRRWSAQ